MSYETILVNIDGPTATVTMNRPDAYNALSKLMRAELLSAVQDVEANAEVRVCILNAAGKGFSAGNDILEDVTYDEVSDLIIGEYLPILELIGKSDKLYIAQVHGRAAGIGAAIAMACDFVTMAEDSAMYMAFAAIALIPDGGACYQMVNAMGYRRALEAVVEGGSLSAQTCLELGIANKVFAAEALTDETRAWADSLTKRAPLALAAAKRVLRATRELEFSDVVRAEADEQNALTKSKDFARGVAAFQRREAPVFEGN